MNQQNPDKKLKIGNVAYEFSSVEENCNSDFEKTFSKSEINQE